MKNSDPLELLRQRAPLFRSGKILTLANFVSQHYRRVAFMSARELAKEAGVSLPTVVRFVSKLECPGYQHFVRSIQERVNLELTGVERLEGILQHKGPQPLSVEIISHEIRALEQLLANFPNATVQTVADRLERPRRSRSWRSDT